MCTSIIDIGTSKIRVALSKDYGPMLDAIIASLKADNRWRAVSLAAIYSDGNAR